MSLETNDRLSTFHGGIHLDAHKADSTGAPIQTAALPSQLIIPTRQHIGAETEICVKPGDHVYKGDVIAKASVVISAPIHASSSGIVSAIEARPIPHASGQTATCIIIDTDGKDECQPDLPSANTQLGETSAEQLRHIIRNAGIVGLGGAAFPTAVKLTPPMESHIGTLIINGAECEPYITCDDMLMREQASSILRGIAVLQQILQPGQTLVGIEDNKPQAIAAMQQALESAQLNNTRVVKIPTIYPTGGEKQLIKVLTGKEVPSHSLPANIGIVCQNIATAYAIHKAVNDNEPLIEKVVTVTGDGIQQPGNWRVRIGTPFSDLIRQAGGYSNNAKRLLMGGPMMGVALHSDAVPVIKSTNCILSVSHQVAAAPENAKPCIRCGECTKVCPAQLLPQQMYWYARARDFDKIQDYNLFDCIECGCCSYVCPSQIPLVQYYRYAKTEIWQQERDKARSDAARKRHEIRQARLDREAREKAERLAKKKAALKKPPPKSDDNGTKDPKKAAIEAAMARVKAKKAAQENSNKNAEPDATHTASAGAPPSQEKPAQHSHNKPSS